MLRAILVISLFLSLMLHDSRKLLAETVFAQRCADNNTFVTSLYKSILRRGPDSGGHSYWMNMLAHGSSREWVIEQFFNSQEYRGFGRDNRSYATDLYHGVLGRNPDAGGLAYWIQELNRGVSRNDVLQRFFASEEYQGIMTRCASSQPPPQHGVHFALRCAENNTFVTSLYKSILRREPDSGGHSYWMNKLAHGSSREWVIEQFYNSQEYRGFGRDNRSYATDLYHGVLGRNPDAGGLSYWIQELSRGVSRNDVLQRFFASEEYRQNTAACP